MALIRHRKLETDSWQLLKASADGAAPSLPSSGDVIVPLGVWRASREALVERDGRIGRIGVWLAGGDDAAAIADDLAHLGLVAVHFASFTDGRGYSTARLLRERYGWRGELRAIGDVQRDQLHYLLRCGFDAFALRDADDIDNALAAFDDFTDAYQTAHDRPVPLFRRRVAEGQH